MNATTTGSFTTAAQVPSLLICPTGNSACSIGTGGVISCGCYNVGASGGGVISTAPQGYVASSTPPALPSTAKYHSTSLLANGTVNDAITSYYPPVFPCDNCYHLKLKDSQTSPITFRIPSNAGVV
jgi:hypothetical protein